MNATKLFSNLSLREIWDKLLKHDKAMNSTILVLPSGGWIEQSNGTFINRVNYSTFKNSDRLTVDLYDDGSLSEIQVNEYTKYIDNFEIVDGGLVASANTKPTTTMTLVIKGDFESAVNNIGNIEELLYNQGLKMEQLESNFTMAARAIGDALVAKEIPVPEGTSLLEMADIISNSGALDPKVTVIYSVDSSEYYTEKVAKGESVLFPTTFTPTKSGYEFVGWRKDTTASSSVLSGEIAASALTLYAVFKKAVVLSFNGNGSTSGSTANVTSYKYYNNGNSGSASFTLPSPGFAKTNYRFTKWALSSANGTQYATGATVTHAENATYYALWEIQKQTGSVEGIRGQYAYVTFPLAFSTTPTVTFTEDINYSNVSITSKSTTGVTFKCSSETGTSFSWKGTINWTAYI